MFAFSTGFRSSSRCFLYFRYSTVRFMVVASYVKTIIVIQISLALISHLPNKGTAMAGAFYS